VNNAAAYVAELTSDAEPDQAQITQRTRCTLPSFEH
jgi:hypothetical protein